MGDTEWEDFHASCLTVQFARLDKPVCRGSKSGGLAPIAAAIFLLSVSRGYLVHTAADRHIRDTPIAESCGRGGTGESFRSGPAARFRLRLSLPRAADGVGVLPALRRVRGRAGGSLQGWMTKHQYDPEHGKNQPVNSSSTASPDAAQPG